MTTTTENTPDAYGTYRQNIDAAFARDHAGADWQLERALGLVESDALLAAEGSYPYPYPSPEMTAAQVHALLAQACYTRELGLAVAALAEALHKIASASHGAVPASEIADFAGVIIRSALEAQPGRGQGDLDPS
jgi:hypothetical protein